MADENTGNDIVCEEKAAKRAADIALKGTSTVVSDPVEVASSNPVSPSACVTLVEPSGQKHR